MIKLTEWSLSEHLSQDTNEKCYRAHGFVSGHPRLEDGIYIHTSIIENIRLDMLRNCLIMFTHSKNEYELLLADINFQEFEQTQGYLQKLHVPVPDLSECQKLQKKAENELMAKVDGILQNNELYLRINGVFTQNAFFKNAAGEVRKIRVTPHIGMFQDSYLIADFGKGEVDFRYFDKLYAIEPYHWSDGLKAIRIENIGSTDIVFRSGDHLVCKSGEVTVIDSSQYSGEGPFRLM